MEQNEPTARLLIVANRLPLTVKLGRAGVDVVASSGGLATGLRDAHERSSGLWIGWPGDVGRASAAVRRRIEEKLAALRCVSIQLSAKEITRFYEGFSNGTLWPLFHYLLDRIPLDASDWETYRAVNERFAEVTAQHWRPGDLIWVHDYQLLLLPGLLRRRLPEARIGFFLHIPFPSADVFRTLPWRREILEGLLGADLIGFHTFNYLRHFTTALLHLQGLETEVDQVRYEDREIRLGVFPMGIDAAGFRELGRDPEVVAESRTIKSREAPVRLLVGVDRLDYTKGIPRKLHAFERLLERDPSLHGRVRLLQLAVPSRSNVEAYAAFRRQVDELVGRINGAFGTVHWTPVHYLHRSVTRRQLVALYRAADVMLVTPLRDGMNLVAKEFIASREDEDGVLVLSEFAGAASELGEALLVNPYDIDHVAETIKIALSMPLEERRARIRGLRRRVLSHDVFRWVERFLEELREVSPAAAPVTLRDDGGEVLARLRSDVARGTPLVILLDYDGTLVPFARSPGLAVPDQELLGLLRRLARVPNVRVHVVSGRTRESLEEWLGGLPIALHAEHGLWSRDEPGASWSGAANVPLEWREKARKILEDFAASTPGALLEEKSASLAWHYRMADPEFGALQAKELRLHVSSAFSNAPVEVLLGEKVIEIRPHGINKGLVAARLREHLEAGTSLVAIGDDQTDEDMFAALPDDALSVKVGRGPSRARFRLPGVGAVRALLRELASAEGPVA